MKQFCNWTIEDNQGRSCGLVIAGVDEVGRGAWAGNMVVAAAVYDPTVDVKFPLRDSKALKDTERVQLVEALTREYIQQGKLHIAYAEIDAETIDRENINMLNLRLFKEALRKLPRFDRVIIDGTIADDTFPGICVPKADATSITVATASIFAKVFRDAQMRKLHELYPAYGFDCHVGYGTPAHIAALKEWGPIPGVHRKTFLKKQGLAR